MFNIGIIGHARAGKDTAAASLVNGFGYTRLAFADPLKEMAERINPIVGVTDYGETLVKLSDVLSTWGWEGAKERDHRDELRRFLQNLGHTLREFDEAFWVDIMRRKLNSAEAWNLPVVVTDVRYRNEADMLRSRGFRLVRITRPLAAMTHPFRKSGKTAALAAHASETELNNYSADVTIQNDGTREALAQAMYNAALK